MKLIYSSPNPGDLSQLKDILENAGIACFLRNEISASLAGGIPMSESTPELWIQDDDRLAQAQQAKKDWQARGKIIGSEWTCPACGEHLEAQFTTCWKCGAAKV